MRDYRCRCLAVALCIVTCTCSGYDLPANEISAVDDVVALFDGKTLTGWTDGTGKPVVKGWKVENGELAWDGTGGAIYTEREYGDFELEFEWKIAPGGNSGVKYRVRHYDRGVRNRPGLLGCEYQLFDDPSRVLKPTQTTGALYDLYAPRPDKPLKPAGEYNESKIVVRGNHIEHWLNGEKVVEAEVGSADWKERVSKSKFASAGSFAENATGRIMIQDHGGQVWFRRIILRTPGPAVTQSRR